ncbi:hypothetical protein B0H12DRAFT_1116933 [Mycena haematopus]|nr:hypothetical protein B0H12DRAFT_1116933 [Mycena haematopus]
MSHATVREEHRLRMRYCGRRFGVGSSELGHPVARDLATSATNCKRMLLPAAATAATVKISYSIIRLVSATYRHPEWLPLLFYRIPKQNFRKVEKQVQSDCTF